MNTLKTEILKMSRQSKLGELSPWFDQRLDSFIDDETYLCHSELKKLYNKITKSLVEYKHQTGVHTSVIGMSGGVDSALTAKLLKDSNWHVVGVTMPIHQEQSETDRGFEACHALDLEHIHIDLSDLYDKTLETEHAIDKELYGETKTDAIRRGNIRARLRMVTLYNLANARNGLVASTDNYSELAAGFWTLHGDVGDLSPIQSFLKSWEVPAMAQMIAVPQSIVDAKPTDGLGVDDGDEAQFGMSYLELDLMLLAITTTADHYAFYDQAVASGGVTLEKIAKELKVDEDHRAGVVFDALTKRMGDTWFKRLNPVNIKHFDNRYTRLENFDSELFRPEVIK